jgi:cyclohexyl-isocyanide hydratase
MPYQIDRSEVMTTKNLEIGVLVFPGLTHLDVSGPCEVLARLPNARVHLLWKDTQTFLSDVGLPVTPSLAFDECPELDILCVGGGPGMTSILNDEEVISFVASKGESARYVTSVCAGALILGAAGLLSGYKSACHWLMLDLLVPFGAVPTPERVVIDRNRISGGGVTAGIDFAIAVAAEVCGDNIAKSIQLFLEYQPKPPFDLTIETAPSELLDPIRNEARPWLERRRQAVEQAADTLRKKDAA